MTGGDATELGTIEDDAQVIDKVMASSGAVSHLLASRQYIEY